MSDADQITDAPRKKRVVLTIRENTEIFNLLRENLRAHESNPGYWIYLQGWSDERIASVVLPKHEDAIRYVRNIRYREYGNLHRPPRIQAPVPRAPITEPPATTKTSEPRRAPYDAIIASQQERIEKLEAFQRNLFRLAEDNAEVMGRMSHILYKFCEALGEDPEKIGIPKPVEFFIAIDEHRTNLSLGIVPDLMSRETFERESEQESRTGAPE